MKVNPQCPKCHANRRVIASYKTVRHNPGRSERLADSFYLKTIKVCTQIANKAASAVNRLRRRRYLYECKSCEHEFLGTRLKKR